MTVRLRPRRMRVRRAEIVTVLGGAALLTSSWVVVAVEHRVPSWEADVFRDVNDLTGSLWQVVRWPMQLGSLPGSLVVVALTYGISRKRHPWLPRAEPSRAPPTAPLRPPRLAGAALAASQAAYWGAKAVKLAVSRARPFVLLTDVHVRERASGLGYLSGHTAVAFALATVLAPSLPRPWRPVAFALALVVAFARVYAGAHLPLDTVGGAGLGLLCGTFARWAFGLGGEGLPARA